MKEQLPVYAFHHVFIIIDMEKAYMFPRWTTVVSDEDRAEDDTDNDVVTSDWKEFYNLYTVWTNFLALS